MNFRHAPTWFVRLVTSSVQPNDVNREMARLGEVILDFGFVLWL